MNDTDHLTIRRLSTKAGPRHKRIRIRVGRRYRKRLRRRDVARTRPVVIATDGHGNRHRTIKRVWFT